MFFDGPLRATKENSWSTEIKQGINKGVSKFERINLVNFLIDSFQDGLL